MYRKNLLCIAISLDPMSLKYIYKRSSSGKIIDKYFESCYVLCHWKIKSNFQKMLCPGSLENNMQHPEDTHVEGINELISNGQMLN